MNFITQLRAEVYEEGLGGIGIAIHMRSSHSVV
jgi:hypothetical protein